MNAGIELEFSKGVRSGASGRQRQWGLEASSRRRSAGGAPRS